MKLIRVRQEPHFLVELTRDEVEKLAHYSDRHYDGTCRGLNQVGGIICGFRNRLELIGADVLLAARKLNGIELIQIELSWRDVDLLCKVLEDEGGPLWTALQGLFARSAG